MTPRYIDAHCHLQFGQYDADRDDIIAKMKEEGVAALVVGCDLESSKGALALAEQHEHLYASVGLHPNYEPEVEFDREAFRVLAAHPKVVAIGECGLDYFRPSTVDDVTKRNQKELLKKHLALAAEFKKPLIIHSRPSKGSQDAYQDLIALLTEEKASLLPNAGDIHFFVGTKDEADALIALGFTVSFTAVITFARDYDAVMKSVSLENILAETDSPYVAPVIRRGERNDPLAVKDVAAQIAEVRGEDREAVREVLLANTRRVFGLGQP